MYALLVEGPFLKSVGSGIVLMQAHHGMRGGGVSKGDDVKLF